MGRMVGIELGTSTSAIGCIAEGNPLIIPNWHGQRKTPSVVWASPSGELIAGEHAYKQSDSVRQFKRQMGSTERFHLGNHSLAPEECSALLLRYLKKCAEVHLEESIERAVISVPASWKEGPRAATQEAGRLAGFEVERLIEEPAAAAMAFGVRPDAEGKIIAVYNLGRSTFDVTILRIQDSVFDVVTSLGDGVLGGSDVDRLLFEHVLGKLRSTTSYEHRLDVDRDKDRQLLLACKVAKKELSAARESRILLPSFAVSGGKPIAVDVAVARAELEHLIEPLVRRSLTYFEEALLRARLAKEGIDEIVMVGGSTRIPLVRQRVAELMGKEPNVRDVNPDEAVALGAALLTGIIDQPEVSEKSLLALNHVNHAIGFETSIVIDGQRVSGAFSPIIHKGTRVPFSTTLTFQTVADNQTEIEIKCYQGNHPIASRNEMIGTIVVSGLPRRPAGEVRIAVTFALPASEILDVHAQLEEFDISMIRSFALRHSRLTEVERQERQRALDTRWESSELAGGYRSLIRQATLALEGPFPAVTKAVIEQQLLRLKTAIQIGNSEAADQADLEICNLLFDLVEQS